MQTRTVPPTELLPGDEIYVDGRVIVESVEEGTEPTFAPGETVAIVRGHNAFGSPVARWVRLSETFTVSREERAPRVWAPGILRDGGGAYVTIPA